VRFVRSVVYSFTLFYYVVVLVAFVCRSRSSVIVRLLRTLLRFVGSRSRCLRCSPLYVPFVAFDCVDSFVGLRYVCVGIPRWCL
jgi:hypothetical protein